MDTREPDEPLNAGPESQPDPSRSRINLLTGDPIFYCPLDLHWPRLLPEIARSQLSASARPEFRFNPRYHCQTSVPEPEVWSERMQMIQYSDELPVCWVSHPLLNYPEAYWPSPGMLDLLHRLSSGETTLESLDDECFSLLCAAHVLVLADEDYRDQREALQAHWRMRLAQEGYLHIPSLISPLQIAALREYTRQRRTSSPMQSQDDDYTRRQFKIFDPMMRFWHQHLQSVLSPLVDCKLIPSYSMISYYEDTKLKSHKDRDPCIWNVSVQLDSEPPSAEGAPWPLWLETKHGPTAIPLQAGDALVYRGREIEHWRDPLPPNRRETVLLFHFVDEQYQGPLW